MMPTSRLDGCEASPDIRCEDAAKEDDTGIDKFGGFRVKRGSVDPAMVVLSREGLELLVDDAIHDLAVLKQAITPDGIREYVRSNVRINVYVGRYLKPTAADLEDALELSRFRGRTVECAGDGVNESDEETSPAFSRRAL